MIVDVAAKGIVEGDVEMMVVGAWTSQRQGRAQETSVEWSGWMKKTLLCIADYLSHRLLTMDQRNVTVIIEHIGMVTQRNVPASLGFEKCNMSAVLACLLHYCTLKLMSSCHYARRNGITG